MFDKTAINELTKAQAITAANEVTAAEVDAVISLPDDFQVHDLEKYLGNRRRARGTMETSSIDDFASYTTANAEHGATVFVSPKSMVANAVLNLGTPDAPGHADNRAQLRPRETAAYTSLMQLATGQALEQSRVAEFLEDWAHAIECFHDGAALSPGKAVSAVRNITIEGLRKVEASEQQLSASKSAFEQVTASSKDTLPTHIYFKCVPYQGFDERTFVMRLGIRTSDKPAIVLRVINREQHDEEMADELRNKVFASINAEKEMPVLVGDYTAKS